jgi:hypothetical protein
MFYQAGRLLFVSEDQQVVHVLKPSKFSYARKGTKIEARGFPFDVGPVQKLDSAVQSEDWTLKLTQESFDKLDLQLILDQREATIASIQLPGEMTKITVPDTAPYTVTVTGLTADQNVKVSITSDTDPLYLTQVTGATSVSTGTFKVSADTITFHADQKNSVGALYYLETKTNIKIVGATAAPASYGYCAFKGIVKGTRTKQHVWFPKVGYTRDFEQTYGDKSEITLEYDALTPAAWGQPFAFWDAA